MTEHAAVRPAGVFPPCPLFLVKEYVLTMPNMYARGILFGKMVLELGDTCIVRNDAQDFHADLEFKTKGFFTGTYNSIAGRVKHGSTELGDITGKWSALMEFKPAKVFSFPH
jgi:oxysterol-binding protein-related protein 8